jgi:hypothetical protein
LLDDFLESSNYPTEQALDFVRQDPIPELPFDRLHFGYRLDITGLVLKDAFVALPTGVKGSFNAWVWQVLGDPIIESGTYGRQLPLPFPDEEPPIFYAYDNYAQ